MRWLALAGLAAVLAILGVVDPAPAPADPPRRPIACWGGPAVSWRECAHRQRRNHVAAARTIRRLRVREEPYQVPWPWSVVGDCETTGYGDGLIDWDYNGGSGFDGGLQFHPGTWSAYRLPGYPAYAWQATPEQQVAVARRVLAAQGWGAWPACARRLGLR